MAPSHASCVTAADEIFDVVCILQQESSQDPGRSNAHAPFSARWLHTLSGKALMALKHELPVLFDLAVISEVEFFDMHLKHEKSQYPGLRKSHKFKDTKFSH